MASVDTEPPIVLPPTAEPIGKFKRFMNYIRDTPWSIIQLFVVALIGVSFIIQYGIVVMSLLFEKRLNQIPDSEYEDLSRKDAHMMVIRTMNMNPLGLNVPYPWLVYASLLSALFAFLAFAILGIKSIYTRGAPGFGALKSLTNAQETVTKLIKKLEEQIELLGKVEEQDYDKEGEADTLKSTLSTIEKLVTSLEKLSMVIDTAITDANDETKVMPPSTESVIMGQVQTLDKQAKDIMSAAKSKISQAKRLEKMRNRKTSKGGLFGGLFKKDTKAEETGEKAGEGGEKEGEGAAERADEKAKEAPKASIFGIFKNTKIAQPSQKKDTEGRDFKQYITQIKDLLRKKQGGGFFSRKEPALPEDPIEAANALWQKLENDKRFNLNDNMSMTRFVNAFNIHLQDLGKELDKNNKSTDEFVSLQNAVAGINSEMTDNMNIEISQSKMEGNRDSYNQQRTVLDAAGSTASSILNFFQGGGGAEDMLPGAGKYTPNYALLAPIAGAGLILMITGITTFATFMVKVKDMGNISSDAEYEGIIKENVPRSSEYLEALKDFALGTAKVNPYTWPPRIISMSFDIDNESHVDEIVKMMFMYRLASHYVKNIAMLEGESKKYAADALAKRADLLGSRAESIGAFFGVMATVYVTDMAPYKRFKGEKSYDDVGAMTDMLRCLDNKCPTGEVTFTDMYRKHAETITRKLDEISFRLSSIVDSASYSQRMVMQYKIASDYLDMFDTLNVLVPLGLILMMSMYAWAYIEISKTRRVVAGSLLILAIVPFVIRYFVEWK